MHYNIAIIRIELHTPLPCAILKKIDDSIQSFQPRSHLVPPHSSLFKLVPGNPLVALARFHISPYSLMTAPGIFRWDKNVYINDICYISFLFSLSLTFKFLTCTSFFLFCFYILFSSIEPCDLDCRELFRLNAKISKVFSLLFKHLIIAWFMYLCGYVCTSALTISCHNEQNTLSFRGNHPKIPNFTNIMFWVPLIFFPIHISV